MICLSLQKIVKEGEQKFFINNCKHNIWWSKKKVNTKYM